MGNAQPVSANKGIADILKTEVNGATTSFGKIIACRFKGINPQTAAEMTTTYKTYWKTRSVRWLMRKGIELMINAQPDAKTCIRAAAAFSLILENKEATGVEKTRANLHLARATYALSTSEKVGTSSDALVELAKQAIEGAFKGEKSGIAQSESQQIDTWKNYLLEGKHRA